MYPPGFTPDPVADPNKKPEIDYSGFTPDSPDTTIPATTTIPYTGSPHRLTPENVPESSLGEDIWNELNRPHINLEPVAKKLADRATANLNVQPKGDDFISKVERWGLNNPLYRGLQGFNAGATEGLAKVASGLTSDLGLLTMLPEGKVAKLGLPAAANIVGGIRRIASLPFAVHGGIQAINPNSTLAERAQGVFEAAGGLAGSMAGEHYTAPKTTAPLQNIGKAVVEYKQPELDFNLPEFHQPNLLDEPIPLQNRAWGPRPGQLPLSEIPEAERTNQGRLDLTYQHPELSNKFRREFGPDEGFLPDKHEPYFGTPPEAEGKTTNLSDLSLEDLNKFHDSIRGNELSPETKEAISHYIVSNSHDRAAQVIENLTPEERANITNNIRSKYGDTVRLYRAGDIEPGKYQSWTTDPEVAKQFSKFTDEGKGGGNRQIESIDLPADKIEFPGAEKDSEYIVHGDNALESKSTEVPPSLLDRFRASLERDRANVEPDEEVPLYSRKNVENFGEGKYEKEMNDKRKSIESEMDPAAIRDNYNNYREDYEWTKLHGDADAQEDARTLLDSATDRLRQLSGGRPHPLEENWNTLPDEPLFSRSGKLQTELKVNTRHAAGELTTGYSAPLPAIMVREAVQNAKDAIHGMGDAGRVHVNINDDGFTIHDNGKGMSPEEVDKFMNTLHESGKTEDVSATGGKGIGKATYMLGGKYFKLESVKEVNGTKVKSTMEGTPDEIFGKHDIHWEEVDPSTPTGTKVETKFSDEQKNNDATYHARNMYKDIVEHSRDLKGHVSSDAYNSSKTGPFKESANDTTVGNTNIEGTDFSVHVPKQDLSERSFINAHILNNGMYQYTKIIYLPEEIPDMPRNVIVNAKPTAKEGTAEYPFPTQRESLKDTVNQAVEAFVNQVVVHPQKTKLTSTLQELYDSMTSKNVGGKRNSIIFDPGNRFTPREREIIDNNIIIQNVNKIFDRVADEALTATGRKEWQDKLEGVGTMFSEPGFYGVHVPNPVTKKSSIMVNFMNHLEEAGNDPSKAAWGAISTLFHELGHIGNKKSIFERGGSKPTAQLVLDPSEINNPRLGKFMEMYLENIQHGGETQNPGHAADWLARTAEIMTKYGPSKTLGAVDELTKVFSDKSGGYNGHTKSLLQLTEERRGRPETTKDYLSPTGIKSESTAGREGTTSSSTEANTSGPSTKKKAVRPVQLGKQLTAEFNKPIKPATPEQIKQVQTDVPQAEIPQRISNINKHIDALKEESVSKDEKENLIRQALNFQRTLLTSYDVSGPGRQGLPLIGRKEWWTSLDDMFKAWGSETAFNNIMESIKNDPSGFFTKDSLAHKAGLDLTDALSKREEVFRSQIAEKYIPGVRPSVRAYTAFLNKLRADTFKSLVKEAGAENNMVVAKQIAEFINVSTGRGSLGAFEPSAKAMADIFFAPRYTASRIQNYTRVLNPKTYTTINPIVRREILKSALFTAGTGLLLGQLAKMAGAHVNADPYSADFGKIKFGKTRIDPFAGHQQYLVAAARLLMGKETSSISNKRYDLTRGKFGQPTRADVVGRFIESKLAPLPSFVWAWMQGRDFDGTSFDAKKALANRTIPLVMQDIRDILKDNPTLLQLGLGASASIGGFGVQTYGR